MTIMVGAWGGHFQFIPNGCAKRYRVQSIVNNIIYLNVNKVFIILYENIVKIYQKKAFYFKCSVIYIYIYIGFPKWVIFMMI